jgi:hypothetical protein
MKICVKCKEEKDENEFPFRDKRKGIRRNECILCTKKYRETYYEHNKLGFLENAKLYYEDNKDKIVKDVRNYRVENKDKISVYKKEYYEDNKDSIKQYQSKNRDKIQKAANKQRQSRRHSDPSFRLRTYVSNSIRDVLKGKKNSSTWKSLPYSPQELKEHLEAQFEFWMTWDNHGRYNPQTWNDNDPTTWTWQIDHIIPQTDLPYTSMSDDNFQECWALENLRPLSSKQNIVEGANRSRHK